MKIPVTIRLNPSHEPDTLDEVFISSDDPYINLALRLPKGKTVGLESGPGMLELSSAELEKGGDEEVKEDKPQEG